MNVEIYYSLNNELICHDSKGQTVSVAMIILGEHQTLQNRVSQIRLAMPIFMILKKVCVMVSLKSLENYQIWRLMLCHQYK